MSLATISVCVLHTIISLATVAFYKSRSDYFIETAFLTASDALSYLAAVIALTVAYALISRTFIADSHIEAPFLRFSVCFNSGGYDFEHSQG